MPNHPMDPAGLPATAPVYLPTERAKDPTGPSIRYPYLKLVLGRSNAFRIFHSQETRENWSAN